MMQGSAQKSRAPRENNVPHTDGQEMTWKELVANRPKLVLGMAVFIAVLALLIVILLAVLLSQD